MSLSIAIDKAQRRKRSTKQYRAEVRIDEITAVHEIRGEYEKADRPYDLRMESHFQAMWTLADDEEERNAIARAFADWGKGEQIEGMAVAEAVRVAIETLKSHNPFWIDGCGPEGTAA